MSPLEVLFLGTGTSAGVPMIGCHCPVCTSDDPRDKRTRSSVVISYDNFNVLIDSTPELRLQCVANGVDCIDAVVYTHAHADHIMGLDDMRRFNSLKKGPLDVYANAETFSTISRCFGYAFTRPDPTLRVFRPNLVHRLIDGTFAIGGRDWRPIELLHGGMSVLGFRIDDFAYCTDVSEMPRHSRELLGGLQLLVLDALAWHEHPTHLSVQQALGLIDELRPKRTLLIHMAHDIGHADTSQRLPPNVALAYDGLRVRVGDGEAS